jgi:Spy/CpxP family protein refolding chaperone
MMRLTYSVTALALIAATEAFAQQPERPSTAPGYVLDGMQVNSVTPKPDERSPKRTGPPPEGDPLAAYFFPPELIMTHQRELGLQDSQRATITSEIQKAQARFVELQWKMSAEMERLQTLLEPPVADEAQVLEQIDRTLAVERDIKRVQIALLVRIKNTLTPSQQAKLAELRENSYANSNGRPNAGWQTHFRLGNIF